MVVPLLVDSADAEVLHVIEMDLDGFDDLYGREHQDIAPDLVASDGSDDLYDLAKALHAGAAHAV